MRFIKSSPSEIIGKYSSLELIPQYIGPDKTKGDMFEDETEYAWIEVLGEEDDYYETMGPIGIVCLTENQYLPNSLHLSVLEVFPHIRCRGIGTSIMEDLISVARAMGYIAITLQALNPKARKFYRKLHFLDSKINDVLIMRLFL